MMALALVLAPAGCSLGDEETPQPASAAPRELAAVVVQLERATRARDFAEICDDILTKAARRRAGGGDCARLVRSAAAGIRDPRIELLRIQVEGARATATIRTRAEGQARVTDTLSLREEGGEWRVESLSD
jgi:hypothetical protein